MDNPEVLKQLKDIHLPDPVGFWPLAPGWYLIIGLCSLLILLLILWALNYYRNARPKRQALKLLADYKRNYQQGKNDQPTSANVSELLRRVALAYHPRTQVASLEGRAWINFLNDHGKDVDFNAVQDQLLLQPYKPESITSLNPLFTRAERWIKQRRKVCV